MGGPYKIVSMVYRITYLRTKFNAGLSMSLLIYKRLFAYKEEMNIRRAKLQG